MRRLLSLVIIAILLALPRPSAALWGEKSPACPRWVAPLERLEQEGRADSRGARRWRNRIADRCVAMNEIQMLGSHNSYHVQPRPALMELYLMTAASVFGAWEYTHPPLDQQFSTEGIRQIEL